MNVSFKPAWTAVFLALAVSPASAIEFAWYQQRAPGNASGEMRLENLVEGALEIDTPGLRMEYGILRIGDVAIVTLAETSGPSTKDVQHRELVVVASQGDRPKTRVSFQLAMPAQANPTGSELAAANSGSGRSTTSGMSPETDPAGRTGQPQATAENPSRSVHASTANSGAGAAARESEASSADTAGIRVRTQDSAFLPAASNPSPGIAGPDELAGITRRPSPGGPDCPVLVLRPGSLRENVGRLVRECGARLGRWHTSSSAEWLVDWKVPAQELLTRNNADGLPGLLRLLEDRYRLAGVPDLDRPGVIDFYRLRMDSSPSGHANTSYPNTQ